MNAGLPPSSSADTPEASPLVTNLVWLVRRLRMADPRLRDVQAARIRVLCAQVPAGARAQVQTTGVIGRLCKEMGSREGRWHPRLDPRALPALACTPDGGVRLVSARTDDGRWVTESPAGRDTVAALPEGTLYQPAPAAAGRGVRSPQRALAMLRAALAAQRGLFAQIALASVTVNVLALAASFYTMQVYDRVIPTQGLSTLTVLTLGVLIALVIDFFIRTVRARLLEHGVSTIDFDFSHGVFRRLLGVRIDQMPAAVGTLAAQLKSYESVRAFASSATLFAMADAPFALFFIAVIGLIGGWELAAIPAFFLLAALLAGFIFSRRVEAHADRISAASNRRMGLIVETVASAEALKASGARWQRLEQWDRLNREAIGEEITIRRYNDHAAAFAAFIQQTSYTLLIAIGAWKAATTQELSMGALIACAILSSRVFAPVSALPGLIVQWAHARIALRHIEQVFALGQDNQGVERPLGLRRLEGRYALREVVFAYPHGQAGVKVPAMDIAPGERIAVLGAIGTGKSTLLRVLAGLYKPQHGTVLLDGLDVQQIDRDALSERVGYLPQDVRLIAGTLRDNLLLGLGDLSDETLLDAARKTGLVQLVASHPMGLDLPIAEGGGGVSGGQRQLIGFTRLLLQSPDLWLLDEPTSAMDEATEQRCLAALRAAVQPGQTMILVTHKPSMLPMVDRLIVLRPGGGIIDGSKEAVMEQLRQHAQQVAARNAGTGTLPGGAG